MSQNSDLNNDLPVHLRVRPAPLKEYLTDKVAHPSHYTFGKYEVIDVIEDWKLDYHLGSAVAYIARSDKKHGTVDGEIEDLKKAIWYLQRKVEKLEGKR